jgi:uncharacterized membrane protein YeaQ/YmgE (transglycosylase-associated protein family)
VELVALVVTGLVVGALARLALPGPDPIPIWATILLGIAGGIVGGGIGLSLWGPEAAFPLSVVAATLLLFLYRRFVQKRPLTGPGARRLPSSGGEPSSDDAAARLRRLQQLRDDGLISEEEFARKREELVAQL